MARSKKKSAKTRASPDADGTGSEGTLLIETLEQFKALAHPLRQRIFERLAVGTHTAKQVAQQLGEKPTRLYHHVSALERAGLIRLVRTRPIRGATEKYYRAAGRRIEIDPAVFGDPTAKKSFALAQGGIVDGILTNLRRDLAALMAAESNADPESQEEAIVAQVEIRGDSETLAEYRRRLYELLGELQSESQNEDEAGEPSEARRLVVAWYPVPEDQKP